METIIRELHENRIRSVAKAVRRPERMVEQEPVPGECQLHSLAKVLAIRSGFHRLGIELSTAPQRKAPGRTGPHRGFA